MRISILLTLILFSYPLVTKADQDCDNAYEKIYHDHELTISVFLGYSEYGTEVGDPITKSEYIEKITARCNQKTKEQLCEFSRHPDDADIFVKTIKRSDGKTEKIRLRLRSSAASASHRANMSFKKPVQDKISQDTETKFLASLQTDDVVFYNGHARRGTGPGFKPMTKTDWINAVATKESLNRMTRALKIAKKKPALIGMITCEGEEHYGKALQEAAPNSGLLLTRQTTTFGDSSGIILSSLESLLQKKCADEFRSAIKESVQQIYNSPLDGTDDYRQKLPEIYNFFETNKKKFSAPRGAILTLINGQWEESVPREVESQKQQQRQRLQPSSHQR